MAFATTFSPPAGDDTERIDTPTALLFLDFDGVAGQWQADPIGAVKDIVARLGAPYSDTDFVWFFSSKHGLKLDRNK